MDIKLKWIDAGKIIEANPEAKVLCPNCGNAFLNIKDEETSNSQYIDRYMICPSCHSYNVLTFKK